MAKIYKSTEHKYVCELWGASTKHPDSIFYFDDFKKSDVFEDEMQVFKGLLECASKLTWPMHAKDLAEQALRDWYPMGKDWKAPDLEEWSTEHWHQKIDSVWPGRKTRSFLLHIAAAAAAAQPRPDGARLSTSQWNVRSVAYAAQPRPCSRRAMAAKTQPQLDRANTALQR